MLCPSYQVAKSGLEGTQIFWLLIQHVLMYPWKQYFHLSYSCPILASNWATKEPRECVKNMSQNAAIQAYLILLRFHFNCASQILHFLFFFFK